MIKVIIFDADGVLINAEYAAVHLEREFGITQVQTNEFFKGVFYDCIVGKKDLKVELEPYLKKWGWKKSLNDFLDYWHTKEHVIDQPLIDYIQELREKGFLCCLATNQNRYRFAYMLKEMGFGEAFDRVYASDFLGHRKPDREFYAKILEDLEGIEKEEVLFWDDRLENVEAARQFGIQSELYTSFDEFENKMLKLV